MSQWQKFITHMVVPPATSYVNNPSCGCEHYRKPAMVIPIPRKLVSLFRKMGIPLLT